jgi:hypothetical protein
MTTKISLQVLSIKCLGVADSGTNDNNEVFLSYQSDAGEQLRYPPSPRSTQTMSSSGNNVWNLNNPPLIIDFVNETLLTLWDQDNRKLPGASDYLGSNQYRSTGGAITGAQPFTKTVGNISGASYQITTQVLS